MAHNIALCSTKGVKEAMSQAEGAYLTARRFKSYLLHSAT